MSHLTQQINQHQNEHIKKKKKKKNAGNLDDFFFIFYPLLSSLFSFTHFSLSPPLKPYFIKHTIYY